MEAEFKNKIRTFEAVFDRKIRTSRLDFRKCSYKINGVYAEGMYAVFHIMMVQILKAIK